MIVSKHKSAIRSKTSWMCSLYDRTWTNAFHITHTVFKYQYSFLKIVMFIAKLHYVLMAAKSGIPVAIKKCQMRKNFKAKYTRTT